MQGLDCVNLCDIIGFWCGCGSGGRVGCPFTKRLVVQSQSPPLHMTKGPWAGHMTLTVFE